MNNEILLVGIPNSGKSTVFNGLTGGSAKVGNYYGVTVKTLEKTAKIGDKTFLVIDTPGLYSINPTSLEERVTVDKLNGFNGLVIFVCEAVSLTRAFPLIKEVYSKNPNVILAVNMLKEFSSRGGKIEQTAIKNALPFPVVFGDFIYKKDIKRLKETISLYKPFPPIKLSQNPFTLYVKGYNYKEEALDKIILKNKFYSTLFLLLTVAISGYFSFGKYGLGSLVSGLITYLLEVVFYPLLLAFCGGLSPFLSGLLIKGIYGGMLGVCAFIPQMLCMALVLEVLERSGLMARIVYIAEDFFYKTGLNGKAIFPIIMGYGCTAVAVTLTGGLDKKLSKNKAIATCSGVSCSAKLPVLLLLASNTNTPLLFMITAYVFSTLYAFFQLYLCDNLFIKGGRELLVIEMPPYRFPSFLEVVKSLLKLLKQVIIKIGTVIFLISIATYLLLSVSPSFTLTNVFENSLLYNIGKALSPLLIPLGVNNVKITVSLLAGALAKESIASTLLLLYGNALTLTGGEIIALTVLTITLPPCLATLSQVYNEGGKKTFVTVTLSLCIEGYVLAFLSNLIYNNIAVGVTSLILITAFIIIYDTVNRRKTRKTIKTNIEKNGWNAFLRNAYAPFKKQRR